MRRIERLINLIAALLEARQPMTADEIRERVGGYDEPTSEDAFRRAFERDKETLRAMGIPLEVRPSDPWSDQADGYIIPKGRYYLPQLDLEADEVAALRIAAQAVLSVGEEAESGFLKLALDAPEGGADGPRLVWGADVAAEQPRLAPLYQAILDHQRVGFEYATAVGKTGRRTVEPYGLAHRRGNWYLVGRDVDRSELRSFKVSRITSEIEGHGGSFEIPAGFDVAQHLEGGAWDIGGPGEVTATTVVRFDRSMRWWAEQNLREAPAREAPGDALDVELFVANLDGLVSWVVGFGDGVEIVAPDAARRRLLEHLDPYLAERV